jgi:hypothetical protein
VQARYKQRTMDGVRQEEVLKDVMRFTPWVSGQQLETPEGLQKCDELRDLLSRYSYDSHYNVMILPQFEHGSRVQGKKDVDKLAEALANTYAFQMFPEMYDRMFAHTMSKASSQSHTSAKNCRISLIFKSDSYSAEIGLHDLVETGGCYMGKLLLQALDRDYVKCFDGTYNRRLPESEVVRGLGAGSNIKPMHILGVLTYFPFDSDMETKPVFDDGGSEGCDSSKTNPILVFWKNRLVPHDLLKDLFFLQPKTYSNVSVQEFRHRCCGILFFPPEMQIERNKMKLIVDKPSLYDALLPWSEEPTPNSGNCVWKRDLTGSGSGSAMGWLKVRRHNVSFHCAAVHVGPTLTASKIIARAANARSA